MSNPRILFVDRPSASTRVLEAALAGEGFSVARARETSEALRLLREEEIGIVLGEIGLGGADLLREAQRLEDGPPVILFEDFASADETLEVLRSGAFDTLSRPISPDQVLLAVRRAIEHAELRRENRRLRDEVGQRYELGKLVSRDARMQRIFETVEAVADTRATIMIQGESGTGKTLLARAIHEHSARSAEPFVVVNCGALPTALLESELFGHVRGAFTGAVRDHAGKFEAADGGTIFLDEIGTAPPELQVKLLRVVEEGRFERVGDSTPRQVDVRILTATNLDLAREVETGGFREDLYYRIHVVGVEMPPLRERIDDIPILAQRFLERFATVHGRDVTGLDADSLVGLLAHPWPGNVRELENTIERAVLLSRSDTLSLRDLWPAYGPTPPPPGAPSAPPEGDSCGAPGTPRLEDLPLGPLKESVATVERWLVLRALKASGGNRQATAARLGINRTTLFNKMRRYDLSSFPTSAPDGGAGEIAKGGSESDRS